MTQHDLSTLLRDHVGQGEPPAPLPGPTVQAGRRRLRTRRWTEAAAVLAVLAVAGASLATWSHRDTGQPGTGMDPASAAALAGYDAHRMPQLMDEHVRGVLAATVPDLGVPTFMAYDDQRTGIPERYWGKASMLEVAYSSPGHRYAVTISHSRSEAEGDPEEYCHSELAGGFSLECTVSRTDAGDVVISSLMATRPFRDDRMQMAVPKKDLDTVALDRLWFTRNVKVIKSQTLITVASERVKATSRDPEAADFTTPYDDLVAIGTDSELVMPVPPPGENGCPTWSMPRHGMSVSCGSFDSGGAPVHRRQVTVGRAS